MDLLMLVVVCVIVGFVIWLLTTQIPLPPGWAQVIQVLAVIVLVLCSSSIDGRRRRHENPSKHAM